MSPRSQRSQEARREARARAAVVPKGADDGRLPASLAAQVATAPPALEAPQLPQLGRLAQLAEVDLSTRAGCFHALNVAMAAVVAGELDGRRCGSVGYLVGRAWEGHAGGKLSKHKRATVQSPAEHQAGERPKADPLPYEARLRQARKPTP